MALITKPNMQQVWASGGDIVEPSDLKKQQGWTVEVPPHQFENWIQNRQDEYLAHINQRGIPAWDGLTDYEAGGLSYVQGSDGKVYKSVAASGPSSVVSNPTTDATDTYWTVAFADVGAFLTQTTGDARYTQRSNNLSDLTNVATARTNLGAAPVVSPAFTGTPTSPTASVGTNTTQVATTAFVAAAEKLNAPIATVAASSTINLTIGAPNTSELAISGTGVSINGFTVAANRFFVVKMTGTTNTLVNSASLVTGRGANITARVGDTFLMRSTAANTVEVLGYVAAIPPATRIVRITSATVQTVGVATTPATFAPLSTSFTADGGIYQIIVKLNLNLNTTGAGGSNYAASKLLNGATVLDTTASNIMANQLYGLNHVLTFSGPLSGVIDLSVTFEKTYAAGSITVNGDLDDTTSNSSGQISSIEVIRLGA